MATHPKGRKPSCHPDRAHMARGLCAQCYGLQWRQSDAILAVPDRSTVRPLRPYDPRSYVPQRQEGVRQRTATAFPMPKCPKCGALQLTYSDREAWCAPGGCGATYYLVRPSSLAPDLALVPPAGPGRLSLRG